MVNELVSFLNDSPSAFGAVKSIKEVLLENDYVELQENEKYKVKKGGKYFVVRNDTSVIAFNVGKKIDNPSLQICASHTDCPSFKLKPNPISKTKYGIKLNVEPYGGILTRAYFDRPLSLAGRIILNKKKGITPIDFIDEEPFCIIPSMAGHLKGDIENNKADVAKDLVPIVSLDEKYDFYDYLVSKIKVKKDDILGFDLYLYPLQKAYVWGKDKEFVTANHIDNLECAFTTLMGFVNNFNDNNINVYCSFDNEEVGSLTRQGADSDFFELTLRRICEVLNVDFNTISNKAMMLSCDNAHGVHPNYQELYDLNNAPELNKGLVIKFNANQSYTSDSLSSALLIKLLKDGKIDYQMYANKTGIRGGSTLGNLSNRHMSFISVDIGLAQWAMHSTIETAGSKDVDTMIQAVSKFYKSHLCVDNKTYRWE